MINLVKGSWGNFLIYCFYLAKEHWDKKRISSEREGVDERILVHWGEKTTCEIIQRRGNQSN